MKHMTVTAPVHRATDLHPQPEETRAMLTIEIKINGRLIAGAEIVNDSALAEYSDYIVTAMEKASPETGHREDFSTGWRIECHRRRQSAWALVERVAAAMRLFQSEREGA